MFCVSVSQRRAPVVSLFSARPGSPADFLVHVLARQARRALLGLSPRRLRRWLRHALATLAAAAASRRAEEDAEGDERGEAREPDDRRLTIRCESI